MVKININNNNKWRKKKWEEERNETFHTAVRTSMLFHMWEIRFFFVLIFKFDIWPGPNWKNIQKTTKKY